VEYTVNKFKDFTIRHYEIIDSTNEQAKRILDISPTDNLVITADSQTKGRGRLGREWVSEQGNLYFSVIVNSKRISPAEISSFIAGLSVSGFLQKLGLLPQLKWPNDILIDGKKLCGILIEKHKNSIIIGVGININTYPEYLDMGRKACALQEYIKTVSAQKVLEMFLDKFTLISAEHNKNGFEPLRKNIKTILYKLNDGVEIDYLGEKISGRVVDISMNGSLVLETPEGIKEFKVGEIFGL
jgi:BirA family transcriptional regulator, biotin operon repressor / biotin---[acetyl-CoA-carboxylase] ligase